MVYRTVLKSVLNYPVCFTQHGGSQGLTVVIQGQGQTTGQLQVIPQGVTVIPGPGQQLMQAAMPNGQVQRFLFTPMAPVAVSAPATPCTTTSVVAPSPVAPATPAAPTLPGETCCAFLFVSFSIPLKCIDFITFFCLAVQPAPQPPPPTQLPIMPSQIAPTVLTTAVPQPISSLQPRPPAQLRPQPQAPPQLAAPAPAPLPAVQMPQVTVATPLSHS